MQGYPPPRSWWRRAQDEYWSYGRHMRIGVTIAGIIAIICVVCVSSTVIYSGLVAYGMILPPRLDPAATSAPTVTPRFPAIALAPTSTALATVTPTPRPAATATPSRLVSGPYLGGPESIFQTAFTPMDTIVHLSGTVAGYQVELYIYGGSGTDGQGRVRRIEVTNWNGVDDVRAGPSIAKALLPPDAKYVTDVIGTGVDTWLRHVYSSPSIANSIPADDLAHDFGGTPPSPSGNAEWYCYSYYSNTPSECVITT